MSYSEAQDFAEKLNALDAMRNCMGERFAEMSGERALEVGGSGGILAGMVSEHTGHVISTDVADVAEKFDGQFPHLLREKFARAGYSFDLKKLEFLWADAQSLPFRDNLFGLVFSLNAFEHIPDPLRALSEVIRVTRPGGFIYITFDPVWTADSGSHFLHRIGAPWQHLISSDEEISQMMAANGASPDEIQSYCNDMNRLPAPHYRKNFPAAIQRGGGEIRHFSTYSGCVDASYLAHPNLKIAAKKLGLSTDDLLVRNFEFLIEKIR